MDGCWRPPPRLALWKTVVPDERKYPAQPVPKIPTAQGRHVAPAPPSSAQQFTRETIPAEARMPPRFLQECFLLGLTGVRRANRAPRENRGALRVHTDMAQLQRQAAGRTGVC